MTMHETKITAVKTTRKAPDLPPETYASLAHTIRQTKMRKVESAVHDDLLVMMEALQLHLLDEDERITREGKSLEQRVKEIEEREKELTKKLKAVGMLAGTQQTRGWRLFGR